MFIEAITETEGERYVITRTEKTNNAITIAQSLIAIARNVVNKETQITGI